MSASLKKSFADVIRRKGRALLVVLSIFIGVCGLTAINLTEDTLVSAFAVTSGYHAARPDIVLAVDRLDPALLPALAATSNVQMVQYQSVYAAQWAVAHAAHPLALAITSYPDLQHVPLTPFQLTAGRDPSPGEIVMEAGDTALAPVAVGDLVTVDAPSGPVALRVVGLARTPGANPASSGAALAYMSDAGLARLVGPVTAGSLSKPAPYRHEIAVKVRNAATARVNDTAAALQRLLAGDQITVMNTTLATANLDSGTLTAIEGIFTLLTVLAGVAVTLSGLLILNTVTTLVAEQTPIIGTMKAIGGTRGVIVRGYLVTVGIYSLLATLPGLALGLYAGWALAGALAPQVPLALGPFAVAPWVIGLGLAAGFGVPLMAALVPLWLGTRITVREAFAAYGVSAGQRAGKAGAGPLASLGTQLTWVSQVTWLGLRATFRKRWRATLTLVTLTLAAASFLVVQTASASVNATIGAVRANSASDLSVYFNDLTTYAQISDQLATLPNVAAIELSGGGNVTTAWGILQVSAWEPSTKLYHPQLTSGRWLQPGDSNVILLSDDAARKSGLHAGDTITVRNNFGAHTEMTLTIIGTVHQTIDVIGWIGAAIVPVSTMYELEGIPAAQAATGTQEIEIEARDRSLAAVNRLAAAVDHIVNPDGSSYDGVGYYNGARGTVDTTHEYVTRRQGDGILLYVLFYAVALIVGVVGVLGLANALVAAVVERRREIGMLRALGATGRRVARVFWVEALALGLVAWCGGALVGLPLAYGFVQVFTRQVMPVDFYADPLAFAVMLAAVLFIATLASLVPSWRASRQRTADLLRYE